MSINIPKIIVSRKDKKKKCQDCEKKKDLCTYHRFRDIIIRCPDDDISKLKQVFIEICYDREFNTYKTVQFVARMLKQKNGFCQKPRSFVNEVSKFAMMGVRGKRGNSYISPETISIFLKNSDLPFSLLKRHLSKKHFNQCVKNGYPIRRSIEACYSDKLARSFYKIIDPIRERQSVYMRYLPSLPGNVVDIILKYTD